MTAEHAKISIVEGPPPFFNLIDEESAVYGLVEGPALKGVAFVDMRANNPDELVERCVRTWRKSEIMIFDYPVLDTSGNTERDEVPIVGAKVIESEQGKMLRLWVIPHDEDVYEYDDGDDENYEDEG